MTMADFIALFAFLGLVFIGLAAMTVQSALRQRPTGRVRSRLDNVTQLVRNPVARQAVEDLNRAERDARRRRLRQSMGWLGHHIGRVETVSGRKGVYLLFGTALVSLILALIVLLLPIPWWGKLALGLGIPVSGVVMVYRYLNEKFRRGFLGQLPDVLDMIIRAAQAGVPVTQAIRSVGDEFGWPIGPEFRRMGDSLYLGQDMAVVMDEAEARIQLPEFSFLSVCLLLQRETGGSLSETLTNLAGVVRARRDLRLKTKALTAEGRLAGGMISALPFIIILMLWSINREYLMMLFDTEAGNTLLTVAAIMLIIGVAAIRKLSRMEI